MRPLNLLLKDITGIERQILAELRLRYPIGIELLVKIQRNHATPTLVQVIGHKGGRDARLHVRIVKSRNGGGFITTVPHANILRIAP